jgi:NAD(P)-dependent dehydrogenase (short-subunit alcohol dehydrogenase family)
MTKIAVVTGGSSGIGAAIAKRFAREKVKVVVVSSGKIEKAERIAQEIRQANGMATAKTADVCDPAAVRALFTKVAQEEGGLDILVNSAGIFKPTPMGEIDLDIVDQMIGVNLRGTILTINAAVPLLKERGGGKIVNIASVAAVLGIRNYSVYCATKSAVSMLTRSLALELAAFNINVNAIAPGNTATPMNEDIRTNPAFSAVLEGMKQATPSNTVYSSPEEMAELAWYLCSPPARAMHGSTLVIDEGLAAGI